MRALSDADLLTLWESGRHANPVQRALLLVRHAHPQLQEQELRQWPLGRRDDQLLHLRGLTFGEELVCLVECPSCGATLELLRTVDAVRAGMPPCEPVPVREVPLGALRCELQAPTSEVVELAWNAGDVDAAERRLRAECVRVLRDAGEQAAADLDAEQWELMEEDLRLMDPWADLTLEVSCGECQHQWRAGFDIAHFLWEEVTQRARRVLYQVHCIARAYGWSQDAIFALGALRRQSYLECLNRAATEHA